MISIFKKISTNVLMALYQPFGFSILFSILFMFLYLYAREHGWKTVCHKWWNALKSDATFRKTFVLVFYATMILFRTLLNRNMWMNPLSNVMGNWGLYNEKGELTTEAIENLMLFIPFAVLLLWTFQEKLLGNTCKLKMVLWKSFVYVFLFSVSIEFAQLFFRLGTFQFSDLFYNTLGGVIGGFIYWCGCLIKEKGDKVRDKSETE